MTKLEEKMRQKNAEPNRQEWCRYSISLNLIIKIINKNYYLQKNIDATQNWRDNELRIGSRLVRRMEIRQKEGDMKAKEGVLNFLNKILTAELTAAHQYLLHGAMCHNWGYERLHHQIHERVMDEIHHTEELINHILYLEGEPNMQRLGTVNVGTTVSKQFANDLKLEMADLKLLREAIAHCTKVGDFTTRHKLEEMSVETDEHIDWLETQQDMIKQLGEENYLSEQIKKGDS